MAWDETSPSGSRDINLGDNDIRQVKADLRQYLATEHVSLADVPSTLTGHHKFLAGTTAARPAANANSRRIYFNTTRNQLEVENLSTTSFPEGSPGWNAAGIPFLPSGTAMVFYQAAPPTGWTAVAVNDKALRVVTSGGSGGTNGGTNGFATAFAATNTGSEAAHTHTTVTSNAQWASGDSGSASPGGGATAPVISDKFLSGISGVSLGTFNYQVYNASVAGQTTSAGTSHNHTTPNYAPTYSDVIIATKD